MGHPVIVSRNSLHVTSHFSRCRVKDGYRLKVHFCRIALEFGKVDACEEDKLFPKLFTGNNLKMPKKVLQQNQRDLTVLAVVSWLFSNFPTIFFKWETLCAVF